MRSSTRELSGQGRGQETPGEDPTLTASFGVEFTRAMQGAPAPPTLPTAPHQEQLATKQEGAAGYAYLKTSVCLKHFAGYSYEGSGKSTRLNFDANFTQQDLAETYLPGFQASVQQGEASGIMVREGGVKISDH